jgi:hypothetical protein
MNWLNWIKNDFNSHPLRFCVECVAWIFSISCSIILAITVKDPAFYILYPLWISGCIMYAWAAWTRKSFGMLANYFLLATIDVIGFMRYMV